MTDLHVERSGEGARAVLVHGSISTGEECWQGQRPLADAGFQLVAWERRGYGASPDAAGEDYLQDARDTAGCWARARTSSVIRNARAAPRAWP